MASVERIKAEIISRGGWERVYSAYNGLSEHIARNPTRHGSCPKTGDGKDCFRFFKDWAETGGAMHNSAGAFRDGISLLTWYTGQSVSQVLKEIESILGGVTVNASTAQRVVRRVKNKPYCTPKEAKERTERLRRNYKRCVSLKGTPGETYLRNRGITMPLDFLDGKVMYNPALYYKDDSLERPLKLQGLCSMVFGSDYKPLTMHRTFLGIDGHKAKVENEKLMFSATRAPTGGCIPLDAPVDTPFGRVIGTSEGLETGLSVRQETGCPMWVGISDRLMENINCLGVDVVLIWADKDPNGAGEEAAERMQKRLALQGINAFIYVPQTGEAKADWNDILVKMGKEGFPQPLKPEWKVYGGDE